MKWRILAVLLFLYSSPILALWLASDGFNAP